MLAISASRPELRNNDVFNIAKTGWYLGIHLLPNDTLFFQNNRIHHSYLGVQFKQDYFDSVETTIFEFNTIAYCYRPMNTHRVENNDVFLLRNNIFAGCEVGIYLVLYPPNSAYNVYWNKNEYEGTFRWKLISDLDLYGDPHFVGEYDLHLQSNSIAIDRADPAEGVGKEPEPNGGRANIGGYGTTSEATISNGEQLGPLPTMIPRDAPFQLSVLNVPAKDRQKQVIRIGNYGDQPVSILSYALSDSVNLQLRSFKPMALPPFSFTPQCTLFFQPVQPKIFVDSLIVRTNAGDISLSITGQSTGQPILTGNIRDSLTMTKGQSPYIIKGSTNIPQLTIEPGVTVLFCDSTSLLIVGTFYAVGTREEPIIFDGMSDKMGWEGIIQTGNCNIQFVKISRIGKLRLRDYAFTPFEGTVSNLVKEVDSFIVGMDNFAISHDESGRITTSNIITSCLNTGFKIGLGNEKNDMDGAKLTNMTIVKGEVGAEAVVSAEDDTTAPPPDLLHNFLIANNDVGVQFSYFSPGRNLDSSVVRNVCLWNNEADGWAGGYWFEHLKSLRFENVLRGDPLFIRSPNYPYALHRDSPCIDTGYPNDEPDPDGSPPDFGGWTYDHNNIPADIVRIDPDKLELFGEVGDAMTFTALGDDPEGWKLDYLWQVGDSSFWGEPAINWTFTDPGEVTVAVQAFDGFNYSETVDWRVNIAPLAVRRSETPDEFAITAVYPNPFNDLATIRYTVPSPGTVELTIYDIQGRLLLRNSDVQSVRGIVQQVLDFSRFPTGLYFVRVQYKNKIETRKLIHLK